MSKLTQALIPGYGANPTKPNSNPLKGLAPNPETGLPSGLPSGVAKDVLRAGNPVGGIGPDANGDIGYQKGWLDQSSNGTPASAPKPPGYNVWADPDMKARGWGWSMGADGALHEGDHSVPWGGTAAQTPNATGGAMPTQATGQGNPNLAQLGQSISQGVQGMAGGGLGGIAGFGRNLAQGIRQFNANGGMNGQPQQPQQGPAMGPGGPQGGPPMGMQPQTGMPPPTGGMGPAGMGQQNPQAMQALIAQLRQQQQGQAQPGPAAQ